MATISTIPEISGYPMLDVVSFADSAREDNATGQIYMMLTDLHYSEKDLLKDNKLTLLFTMAQYKNCSDPMEPTCARLMMTGSLRKVAEGTQEHEFGQNAMFSRHPNARNMWINYPYHEFYLAKVDIQYLMLQDFYGRPNVVPVEDYWAADIGSYEPPSEFGLQLEYSDNDLSNLYYRKLQAHWKEEVIFGLD